ncbi:transglutaminase domain-containing protein [Caldithrix abyssi DSM 13497]|uniref:Transglutaminase domain-containing protein n=1 Tax=Caldithrix abyssi DSM 13497 TaxID=880073 RepID=H1XPJ6_CALAY|nr:Transglutaminase-like enzyme, putative cysteine protease [Caldithrix abyssi DSM 13497]EHO43367.1 transglutaminase domain-containing protein [Caldithrix abyssi DSM 13497]
MFLKPFASLVFYEKKVRKAVQRHAIGKLLLPALAFSLLQFGCSSNQWARQLNWKELSLANLTDSTDYPQAHAVILLDEGKVTVEGKGEIKLTIFERRKVIRILDRGGLPYANVVIPYTPGSSSIEKIEARTIHPDGRISVLKQDQIFDIFLYPQFIFYADQKAKKFTFPDVEPGDVIEYRYRMVFSNLTLYHSWKFQDFIPVLRSRFELAFPSSWNLRYKTYNYTLQPDSIKRPTGFKKVYRWQAKDVPPLIREPAMPPAAEVAAYLLFAPLGFKDWQDVANWYAGLSMKRMQPDQRLKTFTVDLLGGAQSKMAKIKKIYEWTRDHIRYVAIAIGIGSFQPHFAAEVFENRYGDCKDMVTLMCAMAKAAHLKMYPVLISTRQNGKLDTSLATPFRFNHVIAVAELADGRRIYLDPTHKGAPFGFTPWYLQNVWGLIIKEENDFELIRLPNDSTVHNRTTVRGYLKIQENGSAFGDFSFVFNGSPAARLRAILLSFNRKEQEQWLEDFLCRLDVPFTLQSFHISGLADFVDSLTIKARLRLENTADGSAHSLTITPGNLIRSELWQLFRSPQRVHPVALGFKFEKRLRLTIDYPESWEVQTLPVLQDFKSPFGRYFVTVKANNEKCLTIKATFAIQRIRIMPETYPSFRQFVSAAHQALTQPLLFRY